MSCFKGISLKSGFTVKCLSRGSSKIWRGMSGRNSGNYSINHEFLDGISEEPVYKIQELQQNTNAEQYPLQEVSIESESDKKVISNSNAEEELADIISNRKNASEDNKNEDLEICQDVADIKHDSNTSKSGGIISNLENASQDNELDDLEICQDVVHIKQDGNTSKSGDIISNGENESEENEHKVIEICHDVANIEQGGNTSKSEDIISNREYASKENKHKDIEIYQDIQPNIKQDNNTSKSSETLKKSETTDASTESHYITCRGSNFGYSYCKLEELLTTDLDSTCDSIPTEIIRGTSENSDENEHKIGGKTDMKSLDDSERQNPTSSENQNIKTVPNGGQSDNSRVIKRSYDRINRLSRDYDLIEYSSINLEDYMTRVYDSISEHPHLTIPEEQRKIMIDFFKASFRMCENKTDDELIADLERIKDGPIVAKVNDLPISNEIEIVTFGPNNSQIEIFI